MTLVRTFVRTHNAVRFADPFKVCNKCGGWVTGVLDNDGPIIVTPCEHTAGYTDVCPNWSPVDGCSCDEVFGHVAHGSPPTL
jgi:hypothetical protein